MAKVTLSDEEKIKLLESINNGTELSPDFLPKLFPSTMEKFDVQTLDKAKIPTLEYAGKRSKAAILAEAWAGIWAAPLQEVRSFGEAKDDEWKNLIVQGDNLQFLKTCYRNEDPIIKDKVKGKVKLIYIDPPFATKSDFWWSDWESSYTDKVDRAEFLETLKERLFLLRELLAEDGSIYIHLDMKMVHYVKILMDEIFGNNNIVNEIIWKRRWGSMNQPNCYGNVVDYILYYSKTNNFIFKPQKSLEDEGTKKYIKERFTFKDDDGRIYMKSPMVNPSNRPTMQYEYRGYQSPPKWWLVGKDKMEQLDRDNKLIFPEDKTQRISRKIYLDEYEGQPIDCMWDDIYPINPMSKERVDYPTQKPESLIERIIMASVETWDLIIDCFAGSGTTAAVAEKIGCNWIACDFGKHSIYTIQRRLLRIWESKSLLNEYDTSGKTIIKKWDAYNKSAKAFSVISAGAYDFSHVMALGKPEHRDTYIAFVLGLFGLVRDMDKADKYKLACIYAEKEWNPVEVYPVWDDQYLKNIRIDEVYLKGIISQSGWRLRGKYYIIAPESCVNIGDTTLKNQDGKDVEFIFLNFPYKVLEDASRHMELHDQPSSQSSVNELITSTAFYFNEEVSIGASRSGNTISINSFDTKILDKEWNRFPGIEWLAMILVDIDHESWKPFDMDKTIFAKDIKDNLFTVEESIGKSIAIIAIDRHGNESKPLIIQ